MATLTINGQKVTVDDSFLHLSHDEQQSTVDEIASKMKPVAPPPDKYQQAAIDENARLQGMGAPDTQGFTRRLIHGATLGADTTLSALATTPAEMIRHGTFDPTEGYSYAKAREDLNLDEARKKTGALGTAAEIAGGGMSGAGLASGGLTAARLLAPEAGIVPRALASAADAAGIGGVSGAMEGNGTDRVMNAVKGAGVGAALGGIAPFALAGVRAAASPIISNIRARLNPEGYAQGQVARAIQESGRTPNEIALDTIQAANEGQGAYTVADAMGNPGQRMLSTVARAPGEGRTAVVEALNSRQADQGRRLANTFREGFDAPQTAEQTRAGMVENANFEAGRNYAPVKRESTPIDVSAPVAIANRAISPAADRLAAAQGAVPTDLAARAGIEQSEAALRDPIGAALKEARSYLASPTLTSSNVNQAFRAKTNLDGMISKAADNKQGALIAELTPIRDALDEALAKSSSNYAAARDAYRVSQKRIGALDLGKEVAAKPGRPEDTIRQFSALTPEEQQAFRAGYADPYVRDAQNAAFGTDKTRPLTSDAVQQEFDAFAAPSRADLLKRQIGREKTMFETRAQATGGSRTADNLNDHAAMAVDPHFVGQILTGNLHGAVKSAMRAGHNALTGNTPEVRQEVAKILLQRGQNMNPATLEKMVDQVVARMQHVNRIVANLGRGAAGGVAVARPGQNRQ